MFKTSIAPCIIKDSKLYKYVKDTIIGIIEIEVLDYLKTWNQTEPLDEYLGSIFPRTFIQRNPQKALQVIYDLDDIAQSDAVRENLPPLHIYAMYQIIRNYEDFKQDISPTDYDIEIENYIRKNYKGEKADFYLFWFQDILEDFVEQYDDEFIWLDIWEHRFIWYINHPDEFPLLTPEVEEILELMPNDIIYQWNKLKKDTDMKDKILYDEYDFFISHASEDKQTVAEPLAKELENLGAKVWLDKFEIKIGSSLRKSIDYGISHSKHGIIILSLDYMRKFWTEKELNALFSKLSIQNSRIILPIRHGVTQEDVMKYSPILSDIFALNTRDYSIYELARQIYEIL